MAQTCGTCGALTGAIMGMGLALGRRSPGDSVRLSYAATQRLVTEFEQEFGARDCHLLLGREHGTAAAQAMLHEQRLGARCAAYTGKAAEIAATILAEAHG